MHGAVQFWSCLGHGETVYKSVLILRATSGLNFAASCSHLKENVTGLNDLWIIKYLCSTNLSLPLPNKCGWAVNVKWFLLANGPSVFIEIIGAVVLLWGLFCIVFICTGRRKGEVKQIKTLNNTFGNYLQEQIYCVQTTTRYLVFNSRLSWKLWYCGEEGLSFRGELYRMGFKCIGWEVIV